MESKIVKCVDCGKEYPRKELNRHFRCHDCTWPKMLAVMTGMIEKTGPEYEKWRHAMKRAVGSL